MHCVAAWRPCHEADGQQAGCPAVRSADLRADLRDIASAKQPAPDGRMPHRFALVHEVPRRPKQRRRVLLDFGLSLSKTHQPSSSTSTSLRGWDSFDHARSSRQNTPACRCKCSPQPGHGGALCPNRPRFGAPPGHAQKTLSFSVRTGSLRSSNSEQCNGPLCRVHGVPAVTETALRRAFQAPNSTNKPGIKIAPQMILSRFCLTQGMLPNT